MFLSKDILLSRIVKKKIVFFAEIINNVRRLDIRNISSKVALNKIIQEFTDKANSI